MWIPPEAHTASTGILNRVHDLSSFRNGTESRDLLPLWMPPETLIVSTGILSRIIGLSSFRNGTESRREREGPAPTGVGGIARSAYLREAALPDGSSNYSPASTLTIISSTVEQKHGMAASAADMKPREAMVANSSRRES